MADNDFQIDTLHSSNRENQWALIAFFPRRSSLPEGYYLSPSLLFCLFLFFPLHLPLNNVKAGSNHVAFQSGFTKGRDTLEWLSHLWMATFNSGTAFLQINRIICVKKLHRDAHVYIYLVVSGRWNAENTRVLFYAVLAVNGKMRGVEMNFDL